jgi:hypothetical protein
MKNNREKYGKYNLVFVTILKVIKFLTGRDTSTEHFLQNPLDEKNIEFSVLSFAIESA